MKNLLSILAQPIPEDNRRLLDERMRELPPELQVPWQAVGRHLPHCGFLLGPSYCSFGCSHCYLPANANRVPLPAFEEMTEQIDANRRLLGHAGHLQITGGDVVDAYVRAGRSDELVRVVRYATDSGLIPMLMTHGQKLLEDPQLLDRLVVAGGLRKIAVHIDVTQAGRPGFPRRDLTSEADLHPLRESFVELILGVQKRTGHKLTAAHTVTVTEENLDSVGDIIRWLLAEPRRLRAFSMLSLQPEADIGRTRASRRPATPETSWREVCKAVGRDRLAEDNLWFGDPACSRMTTLLVLPTGQLIDFLPADPRSRELRHRLAGIFGGAGGRGANTLEAIVRRIALVARHPRAIPLVARYFHHLLRREGVSWRQMASAAVRGRLSSLNIVQHNFMSADEVRKGGPEVKRRLDACSFRGAVKRDDGWHAVPMCSLNTDERENIYAEAIERQST